MENSKMEDAKKKYETYIANLEWHLETNNPPANQEQVCVMIMNCYKEFIDDLEQFKAQEQLSEEEAYALWRELTPQPSDTLYDKSTFEWHRRNGRLQTAKDFHNIAMAFPPNKAQEQNPVWVKASERLPEENTMYFVKNVISDLKECIDLGELSAHRGSYYWLDESVIETFQHKP